jgi:hypothetical protein
MESQSELGLERPSDLTVDGDAPDGVDRGAFLTRSAVAGAVTAMYAGAVTAMYKERSEGGLAVSLVHC